MCYRKRYFEIYRDHHFRDWLNWMKEKCQDCMCTLLYVLPVFFLPKKNIYTLCFVSKCFLNVLSVSVKDNLTLGAGSLTMLSGVLNQELV